MNDKGIVTSGQIFVLLFIGRIIMAIFCSSAISGITSLWDYFLPMIISFFLSMLMLVPVLLMYRQNRNLSVSEYSYRYFGKCGSIITIIYALYFFAGCIYSLTGYYSFLNYISPDGIQIWFVTALLIIACIYASFKGLEAISRLSGIVLIMIIAVIIVFIFFLSSKISQKNYIPISYMSSVKTVDAVIFILSRMNEIAVLAMLYPVTKGNITKGAVIWIISVFLFFIAMLLFLTGTLGEYTDSQLFQVYKSIEGSARLQRFNPMFLGISAAGIFCKLSMLLYVISQCVKNVSNEHNGKRFTIIAGILIILLSLSISQSNGILKILFNKYLCFATTLIFAVFIPLIIVIINHIKAGNKKSHRLKGIMRVLFVVTVISLSASVLSGCNAIQLNQRIIVQGIGIDKNNNSYKLTAIVLDTDVKEQENAVKLIYSDGNSVDEAIKSFEIRSGKKLLLSQCLFIMMNETAAENNNETLLYFINNNDVIKNINLMVSQENTEQIITTAVNDMKYKSEDINLLSDSDAVNQPTATCSLFDYISSENNPYSSVNLPYVKMNKSLSALQVSGSCVLKRSDSELLNLNEEETIGSLIVKENVSNYVLSSDLDSDSKTIYRIKKLSSSIKPQIENEKLFINFNISVDAEKISNSKEKTIQKDIYNKVQSGILKTITENGCDIFSLNKYVRSEFPNYYKKINNWTDILKNAEIKIGVTVK